MLEKGADDFDKAMACAAINDHLNIVQLMLENGADNFEEAMAFAASNGH